MLLTLILSAQDPKSLFDDKKYLGLIFFCIGLGIIITNTIESLVGRLATTLLLLTSFAMFLYMRYELISPILFGLAIGSSVSFFYMALGTSKKGTPL